MRRAAGVESLQVGAGQDALAYHPIETIDATASGGERFILGAGFGNEAINGFAASGASPDTIQFATSSFSYLTTAMTQAQDLAAVLAHASNGPSGLTISDSHGDSLTLAGMSAADPDAPRAVERAGHLLRALSVRNDLDMGFGLDGIWISYPNFP